MPQLPWLLVNHCSGPSVRPRHRLPQGACLANLAQQPLRLPEASLVNPHWEPPRHHRLQAVSLVSLQPLPHRLLQQGVYSVSPHRPPLPLRRVCLVNLRRRPLPRVRVYSDSPPRRLPVPHLAACWVSQRPQVHPLAGYSAHQSQQGDLSLAPSVPLPRSAPLYRRRNSMAMRSQLPLTQLRLMSLSGSANRLSGNLLPSRPLSRRQRNP